MQKYRTAQLQASLAASGLKSAQALSASAVTRNWLEGMQKYRTAQLQASLAVSGLKSAGGDGAVRSPFRDSPPSSPEPDSMLDSITKDQFLFSVVAWYQGLSPRQRRNVGDAVLVLIATTACLLAAASDNRTLGVLADGLGALAAFIILCSRVLDTFDN